MVEHLPSVYKESTMPIISDGVINCILTIVYLSRCVLCEEVQRLSHFRALCWIVAELSV